MLLLYLFAQVFVHQYRKLQEMKARDAVKTKSVDDDIKGGLKEGEETSDATKASSTVEQGGCGPSKYCLLALLLKYNPGTNSC